MDVQLVEKNGTVQQVKLIKFIEPPPEIRFIACLGVDAPRTFRLARKRTPNAPLIYKER